MTEPEWYRANRASWDERVGVHIGKKKKKKKRIEKYKTGRLRSLRAAGRTR